MKVKDVMTKDPAVCTPSTSLTELGRLMSERDCGEIPVVENVESMKLVGVVTDRDITLRSVGKSRNPLTMTAQQVMSSPVITVSPDTELSECERMMAQRQIRRLPVEERGRCCGIVAQADLARRAPEAEVGRVLREISSGESVVSSDS